MLFASAGHTGSNPTEIDEIKTLPRTGKIIGLLDHAPYRLVEHFIEEGDRFFLFTDGIFEQFNREKELFGETRLYEILKENAKQPLSTAMTNVLKELDVFTRGNSNQDDITFIGCEIQNLN